MLHLQQNEICAGKYNKTVYHQGFAGNITCDSCQTVLGLHLLPK